MNADLPDSVTVTLPDPIEINGQMVTSVQYTRQPNGRDLQRHTFSELIEGNVKALANVVPKIANPSLTPAIIRDATARNLTAMQNGFGLFFEGVDVEAMATVSTTTMSKTSKTASGSSSSAPKAD